MEEKRKIDISTSTFIKIIIIFMTFALLYLLKAILALIFMAFVIASAFRPIINFLVNKKIPKILSIAIVYAIFIGIIATSLILVIQPMSAEINQFAQVFPEYYSKLQEFLSKIEINSNPEAANEIQRSLINISGVLTQTITLLLDKTVKLFGGLFYFITIIIMAFYFSTEENAIRKFLGSLVPEKHHDYLTSLNSKIQNKLGKWFRGQIILSLFIFCFTFLGLSFLKVRYALILAIIAGIFEIIPYFGPWFAGIIAVFLTILQSPTKAILVAILYLAVQQLENSFLVPNIVGKTTGLNPLFVVIAILVGFQLGGVLGGLIAVPLSAALSVFVSEYLEKKNKSTTNL